MRGVSRGSPWCLSASISCVSAWAERDQGLFQNSDRTVRRRIRWRGAAALRKMTLQNFGCWGGRDASVLWLRTANMMRVWCKVFAETQNRGHSRIRSRVLEKVTVRFVDKQALHFPVILRVSYSCRVQTGKSMQWKKKMAVTSDGTRDVTAHALSVCVFC